MFYKGIVERWNIKTKCADWFFDKKPEMIGSSPV
jgi:hypothetical protein